MTTPGNRPYPPSPPLQGLTPRPRGRNAAVASFVLGLLSPLMLLVCGLGLLLAVAALVLGVIALARSRAREYDGTAPPTVWPPDATGPDVPGRRSVLVMAAVGIAAALATFALTVWLAAKVAECGDVAKYPDAPSREECVEREFPFTRAD